MILIFQLKIIFFTAPVLDLAVGPELAEIVGYYLILQSWKNCFKNKPAS